MSNEQNAPRSQITPGMNAAGEVILDIRAEDAENPEQLPRLFRARLSTTTARALARDILDYVEVAEKLLASQK